MLIKSRWSLVVVGILWETGLLVFAPDYGTFQVLLGLSCLGGIWIVEVLTRSYPHCGKPVGRAQRRCPACQHRPHKGRKTP